jgi:8-oxo-dGTP diphosphatase
MVLVVAAALIDPAGRVLLQQRRAGKAHAGLWEFPGGKVEDGETPEQALVREIAEELGSALDRASLEPIGFASDRDSGPARRAPRLILLYECRKWDGEPVPLDAEKVGWFAPEAIAELELCPLDRPLAKALLRAI